MPSQSHSGWTGIPWHRCDRCGFDFPVSQLTRQGGLILDSKCQDNPIATITMDRRAGIIAQKLSEIPNTGEPALAEILATTDDQQEDMG